MTTPETWAEALAIIRPQMTLATYDGLEMESTQLLHVSNGTYQIVARSEMAKDWLEHRLGDIVRRALASVIEEPAEQVEVVFAVAGQVAPAPLPSASPAPAEPEPELEASDAAATPAQRVASANHYAVFFEKGGAGYSPFSHYASEFYLPLLGNGFALWKYLESKDFDFLKVSSGWSKPVKCNLGDLADALGKKNRRYIGGEERECDYSDRQRGAGTPLQAEADCCGGRNYDRLRFKAHPTCGFMCKYWSVGAMQILDAHGLVTVEFESPTSNNFLISVWRRLHALTPHQHQQLPTKTLRDSHEAWIKDNALKYFSISHSEWLTITEPIIYPLMAGYSQSDLKHNLAGRWVWQEFLKNSRSNPNYGQPRVRR